MGWEEGEEVSERRLAKKEAVIKRNFIVKRRQLERTAREGS